jgi:ADP-ribosyl-[dinitrogen reductase] hydrolase
MILGAGQRSRAQATLLGQLAGDALGSLVEFQSPAAIRRRYPDGPRELADGGTWDTIAGQPTDDGEMALALARTLVEHGKYLADAARRAYVDWYNSMPFDCGTTISHALNGSPNRESQANGALMRISPLGIFGANDEPTQVARWARQDAALTHPHPICQDANALFAMAIAQAVRTGCSNHDLYESILDWATQMNVDRALREAIDGAALAPPADYGHQQGWVLIALRNALWQLLHAPSLEEGVVDTVRRGGDTDTNAAIAGALLGAVHGREAIPEQWAAALAGCRPHEGWPGVKNPRPEIYWPVDAEQLAVRLCDQRDR